MENSNNKIKEVIEELKKRNKGIKERKSKVIKNKEEINELI